MTAGFALSALLAVAATAPQPSSVKQVFDSLESVRHFHDVAISRDGRSVAWSERAKDAKDQGAAFSPDGSRVAFLSDAGTPGKTQIWVASVKAGGAAPRKLTRVKG